MNKQLRIYFAIALFAICSGAKAQFVVSTAVGKFQKTVTDVGGKTYFIMQDPSAPEVEEYKKVIKETWTLTPVEIISYSEAEKYRKEKGNAFVFLQVSTPGSSYNASGEHSTKGGYGVYLYLTIGSFSPSADIMTGGIVEVGIYLSEAGGRALANYKSGRALVDYNFDGAGNLLGWGPGIFKNDLQMMQLAIKDERAPTDMKGKTEVKKLSSRTLFVPEYTVKYSKGGESKVLAKYPLKYKVVSESALNNRIITAPDKPFYYILFGWKYTGHRQYNIINSSTGEIVYSSTSMGSLAGLTAKDFDAIYKEVTK